MRGTKPLLLTPLFLLVAVAAGATTSPVGPTAAALDLAFVERRVMPAVDSAALLAAAKEEQAVSPAAPYRFAAALAVDLGVTDAGTWETLADGSRLWRLRIASPGAENLSVGLSRFTVPEGASLWLYDPAGEVVQGPYGRRDRSRRGRLYTAMVPGEEAVLELHLPPHAADTPLELRLEQVSHGFRGLDKDHGSCNVDVICPQGDAWRDQIRSVGRYTVGGVVLCSGQLVNNTAGDGTPYFLSAFHCDVTAQNDDTVVVYWGYAAPVCGQRDGGSLANSQTGAIFRASEPASDFLLLELTSPPAPAHDVHYAGWDRSGRVPQGSVAIHHPSGHVKSISFNDDPLDTAAWIAPGTHWLVDNWEVGTTEGGSSGACLFDPANGLCVGVLTAGLASCSVIDFDIFGKLAVAWERGNTPERRLRDWLDPLELGVTTLQGADPATGDCTPSVTTLCLQQGRFAVELEGPSPVGPGPAPVARAGDAAGAFWFYEPDNWEVLVKVLDGCSRDGHYWVFAAGATGSAWSLKVTDTATGLVRSYLQPAGGTPTAITDTRAFATCGSSAAAGQARHATVGLDAGAGAGLHQRPPAAGGLRTLVATGLSSRDDGPGSTAASVRARLQALVAGSGGAEAKADETCVVAPIACGETVQSLLQTTDCALDDGTFVDFWVFAGEAGDQVTIDLASTTFDPFLFLLDPAPAVVATDDDGGPGSDARIVFTLGQSGDWAIAVNNLQPTSGDPGPYTLGLQCAPGIPVEPPAAPSSLTASAVSNSAIELGWVDNSDDEDRFEVEARSGQGSFVGIGSVAADTTGVTVEGLSPGTPYTFRVRARNQGGPSAFSNEATATTFGQAGCTVSRTELCLQDGRFSVEVDWRGFTGRSGAGKVVPAPANESGLFSFFAPDNWELLVKVLDGCGYNDRFWVFAAATTNVEYTLRVTDTESGATRTYFNPLGRPAPAVLDTRAFATCP